MAKADLHPTRQLSPREQATIRVALRVLRLTPSLEALIDSLWDDFKGELLLGDDAIDALIVELERAAWVSVCR
jgi:hypothetical protein